MKDLQVTVILYNLYRAKFIDKDNGNIRYMTRISYLLEQQETENTIGATSMYSYVNEEAFSKLRNKLMKPVKATIRQRLENNGAKFVVVKIDDISIK